VSSTWGLLALAAIVAWNAFFVAAEYAFVAVRPSRLAELVDEGSRRAREVLDLQADPTRFISAVQVAITMSSLAAGAVGEPTLRRLLEDVFEPLGDATTRTLSTILAVVLGFAVVTALTVVLGEIVPKTLSLARTERIALATIGPVSLFSAVFRPFIAALDRMSRLATRALGLPRPSPMGRGHTEQELKLILAASFEEGVLEAGEQQMLTRVFDFADTEVRQVMVPRPDVVALSGAMTLDEAIEQALIAPYTRYPVIGEDLDDVQGVVHVRDLFQAQRQDGEDRRLRDLARPAVIVPEGKRLDELLAEFRRTKSHLAVVVDEYGSTAGVVTLEDLLEEIVGEIADEYDLPEDDVLRLDASRLLVNASFPIEEFNERFGTSLPADEVTSLGGLVFAALGRLPRVGDAATIEDVRFVIRQMDGARIRRLEIRLAERAPEPQREEGTPRES
jgi:CBS domain containing-hemolysin-like protein